MCMLLCECTYIMTHTHGSQRTTWGSWLSPSQDVLWGMNLGHPAEWQEPLSPEPFHQSDFYQLQLNMVMF